MGIIRLRSRLVLVLCERLAPEKGEEGWPGPLGRNVSADCRAVFVVTVVVSSESGKGPRTLVASERAQCSLMIFSLGLTLIKG